MSNSQSVKNHHKFWHSLTLNAKIKEARNSLFIELEALKDLSTQISS